MLTVKVLLLTASPLEGDKMRQTPYIQSPVSLALGFNS